MATKLYTQARLELANGTVDWDAANLYAVLVSSAYVYSAAHSTYADVSASEIVDADYSPVDVAGATVAIVDTDDVLYDCNDISFGNPVTIDASGGHLIILVGDEAAPLSTDRLLFARDMADPSSSTNSEFTVTTPNGIYRINAV